MTDDEFRQQFDSRTLTYIGDLEVDRRPVELRISPQAHSPIGHALTTSLVNQLARAHKQLIVSGDLNQPLLCRSPFGHRTLADATAGLAHAINPFIEVDLERRPDANVLLTIGIGAQQGADLTVGCHRWLATFDATAEIDPHPSSIWGALYGSCLAAATTFHRSLGRHELPHGSYSLWRNGARSDAPGPNHKGPINIGRVLQVGAGGVGSALDYWLSLIGIQPEWLIVDGDTVAASDLNRQLLFLAADCGYNAATPLNKATLASSRLGGAATPLPDWLDTDQLDHRSDVLLALANEHGAREHLQGLQPTVLLHATTSNNWQAQSHRHIAGRDDCIVCRIPPNTPRFTCSTGKLGETKEVDAALPFLSATAGLLLAASLAKLELGVLADEHVNFTGLDLSTPTPAAQLLRHKCLDGCAHRLPAAARAHIDRESRWAYLDLDLEQTRAEQPRSS